MIPKELLKKIRRIEIRTSHLANDALAGQYHSAFKGRGMEFEEVRPYQIGDDVRSIDWNVSARFGEPFIKVFREERELTVMLLVDMSRSQQFGTNEQLKRDLVAEVCATLAFSAIKNNDKIGLICFSDEVEKFVPPRKGTSHVLRVIRELLAFDVRGQGTCIRTALEHLSRISRRRSVVFLVSDFQDTGYESALRIARRKHDVILIDVSDRRERELPKVGMMEIRDGETGERIMIDTTSAKWRRKYAALAEAAATDRENLFRSLKVDNIRINTGESFVEPLVMLFRKREARWAR